MARNTTRIRQRTRTRSNRIPFNMGNELYLAPGSSSPSITFNRGVYAGYGSKQTMTDTVGAPPLGGPGGYSYNPMTSSLDIIGGTPASYVLTLSSNGAKWYSDGGNITPSLVAAVGWPAYDTVPAVISQTDLDNLQSSAATKCWANRGKGPTNNFENLFQIRKTIDELRHPFRNFALWSDRWVSAYEGRVRKVRNSRKTQVKVGKDLPLDTYASAWLQYRYGLRLLIKDVKEIMARYDNSLTLKPTIITTRGLTKLTTSDRKDLGVISLGAGKWSSSYSVDETIVCRGTSHDEYVMDLAEQLGLSCKNLLTVGWELIPYSFVVDWFANVSDFLNASVPNPQMRHIGECLSTKRTTTFVGLTAPVGATSGYTLYGNQGSHSVTTVTYSRGNTLGSPALIIQPDFRFDTLTRTADAVALGFGALQRAFGVNGRIPLTLMNR